MKAAVKAGESLVRLAPEQVDELVRPVALVVGGREARLLRVGTADAQQGERTVRAPWR